MNETVAGNCSTDGRPRVGLVVVDDGLYAHRWVTSLLKAPDWEMVCATCLNPFYAVNFNPRGTRGLWRVSLARLGYYGPAATLKFACKSACGRARDLLFKTGLSSLPPSVASAVRARGIEVVAPPHSDINHPDFVDRLASHNPDLLVCAFSQRAKRAFLETARLGCLNVHFSTLPAHRGREPLFQAMLSGKGAGVSVHWMTPELDAGAVVCQQPLDASRYRTLHQCIVRACDLAGQIVPQAIRRAVRWQGDKNGPSGRPSVRGWPSREEVVQFRKRGFRFA